MLQAEAAHIAAKHGPAAAEAFVIEQLEEQHGAHTCHLYLPPSSSSPEADSDAAK